VEGKGVEASIPAGSMSNPIAVIGSPPVLSLLKGAIKLHEAHLDIFGTT